MILHKNTFLFSNITNRPACMKANLSNAFKIQKSLVILTIQSIASETQTGLQIVDFFLLLVFQLFL